MRSIPLEETLGGWASTSPLQDGLSMPSSRASNTVLAVQACGFGMVSPVRV
jgi:hypothetical protein